MWLYRLYFFEQHKWFKVQSLVYQIRRLVNKKKLQRKKRFKYKKPFDSMILDFDFDVGNLSCDRNSNHGGLNKVWIMSLIFLVVFNVVVLFWCARFKLFSCNYGCIDINQWLVSSCKFVNNMASSNEGRQVLCDGLLHEKKLNMYIYFSQPFHCALYLYILHIHCCPCWSLVMIWF